LELFQADVDSLSAVSIDDDPKGKKGGGSGFFGGGGGGKGFGGKDGGRKLNNGGGKKPLITGGSPQKHTPAKKQPSFSSQSTGSMENIDPNAIGANGYGEQDTPKQPLLVDGDNNVVYRQTGGNGTVR
jgi:hypothetical protein